MAQNFFRILAKSQKFSKSPILVIYAWTHLWMASMTIWVAPDPLKFIDDPFHLWIALDPLKFIDGPFYLWMAPQ